MHLVHRGDNCGWSVKEGSAPYQLQRKRGPTPIVLPTVEHHHAEARSLTGGVVYSGSLLPRLVGWYLYGDYSTGNVWAAKATGGRAIVRHVARSSAQIAGFGLDSHGEVLLVDHGGSILRLEPRPDDATPLTKFPRKLSETGLFSSVPDHLPASGVIPYSVNAALWSDGAAKERFLAIPGNKTIGFKPKGSWEFPDGTVLVKTFSLPVGADADAQFRRIETRLLTRQDGEWFGYSYLWNDDQSDAELLPAAGGTRTYQIRNKQHRVPQSWRFPSRSECMVCHTRAASFVLGLSTEQLNGDHDYGHVRANQLDTLIHIGLLDKAPDRAATTSPALVDPNDDSTPIRDRARAWLHVNCAHCHVKEGGGNSRLDLRFDTPLQLMHLLNQPPQHDAFGIPVPAIVAGGSPERSVLRKRIAIRGPGQMPPLGSLVVDDAGLRLIERWINKLPSETAP